VLARGNLLRVLRAATLGLGMMGRHHARILQALQLAEAGVHMLIETPLAASVAALRSAEAVLESAQCGETVRLAGETAAS
jgi:hypothetical protein